MSLENRIALKRSIGEMRFEFRQRLKEGMAELLAKQRQSADVSGEEVENSDLEFTQQQGVSEEVI